MPTASQSPIRVARNDILLATSAPEGPAEGVTVPWIWFHDLEPFDAEPSRDQSAAAVSDAYRDRYRDAMARLGAAVNIVTTDGPGGRAGFAATAVCSVSDSPPTLLVCLNRGSSAYPAVSENKVICVNTIGGAHEGLSRLFGGKTPVAERFAAGTWTVLETGAPVLETALVSFDCRVKTVCDGVTHDILICEVVAIEQNDGGGALIYFDRKYHAL